MVAEEMDGVTREQRKSLRAIEDELEDVKKKLGRIWHHIETTDTAMADASDRIREHRERQERLEYFAEQARADLAQRRKVLDNVNTIAGLRQGHEGLPQRERADRAQGIHPVLRQGDRRRARRRSSQIHHPHFSIDTKSSGTRGRWI